MADAVRVEVHGYAELAEGSRILAGMIDKEAHSEFERVADQVADQVRSSVPVLTGLLASSVTSRRLGQGASVEMGAGVDYAQFVEYGGRGFPHTPTGNFLYPTAMDAEPLLVAAGTEAAESEIGAMRWPTPSL